MKLTRKQAISMKCRECMNISKITEDCEIFNCPLYEWQPKGTVQQEIKRKKKENKAQQPKWLKKDN